MPCWIGDSQRQERSQLEQPVETSSSELCLFRKCTNIDSLEEAPMINKSFLLMIFNRPGVARAVLQTPLLLIHSLTDPFPPNLQNIIARKHTFYKLIRFQKLNCLTQKF